MRTLATSRSPKPAPDLAARHLRHLALLGILSSVSFSCSSSGEPGYAGGIRLAYRAEDRTERVAEARGIIRKRLDRAGLSRVRVSSPDPGRIMLEVSAQDSTLLDAVKRVCESPGRFSFHVVDEANSPAVLDGTALSVARIHGEIPEGRLYLHPGVVPEWEVMAWSAVLSQGPLPCTLTLTSEETIPEVE